ncbi:hypothetical protein [Anaerocolumna sp. MB42-C2]|uniref:hypothetical protein n=1 Tax=Anaerocolumna sp. MB42-C2 TaxID=3070997 RepID=UPI0027DEC295|nr:hypothetical protein [Anaerocolumna sp. MB42-C2]WMJ87404.1 hypothetical protein RBU59_25760 [Anaerocolumna sp. MB42-C2]
MKEGMERMRNSGELGIKPMVLDELVERGFLKPLTELQKKGVMTVVFSDILPD